MPCCLPLSQFGIPRNRCFDLYFAIGPAKDLAREKARETHRIDRPETGKAQAPPAENQDGFAWPTGYDCVYLPPHGLRHWAQLPMPGQPFLRVEAQVPHRLGWLRGTQRNVAFTWAQCAHAAPLLLSNPCHHQQNQRRPRTVSASAQPSKTNGVFSSKCRDDCRISLGESHTCVDSGLQSLPCSLV